MIVTQELTYEDVVRAAMRKTLDEIGKEYIASAYGKNIKVRQPEDVKSIREVFLTVEMDLSLEEQP